MVQCVWSTGRKVEAAAAANVSAKHDNTLITVRYCSVLIRRLVINKQRLREEEYGKWSACFE